MRRRGGGRGRAGEGGGLVAGGSWGGEGGEGGEGGGGGGGGQGRGGGIGRETNNKEDTFLFLHEDEVGVWRARYFSITSIDTE